MKTTLLIAFLLGPIHLMAHSASDSYLSATQVDGQIQADWSIAIAELAHFVDIDANRDGQLTWEEAVAKREQVERQLLPHFSLTVGEETLDMQIVDYLLEWREPKTAYLVLRLRAPLPTDSDAIVVNYDFEKAPTHFKQLRLGTGTGDQQIRLRTPERSHRSPERNQTPPDPVEMNLLIWPLDPTARQQLVATRR